MGQVTREQLESYRSMKEEIVELTFKLEHMRDDASMIGDSIVHGYINGYPVSHTIAEVNQEKAERIERQYKCRIDRLEKECNDIEDYIEDIRDSMTRRIFRMYFIEGRKQKEIGWMVHMDRSTVSKRLNSPVR